MNEHYYDITYTVNNYQGREPRPEERPPPDVAGFLDREVLNGALSGGQPARRRRIPERLTHLRDGEPAFAHWVHGVPPLRPAPSGARRHPSRGGRRYPDIYLAEDEYYAGDIALHFDAGDSGCGDIISLRPADFLALQAAVTDPAKPVTARQVSLFLTELAASFPPDGFGSEDSRQAVALVLKMLEEG